MAIDTRARATTRNPYQSAILDHFAAPDETQVYEPPNSNTGISGYAGTGTAVAPPNDSRLAGNTDAKNQYSSRLAGDTDTKNTGISGYAGNSSMSLPRLLGAQMQESTAAPQGPARYAGGDIGQYIMGLLGGGNTNERTLRDLAPFLDEQFGAGTVQIASDGTARGRLNNLPGVGMATLIGDKQTWGDGGWAFRTGNEQFGSGGGGGGSVAPSPAPGSTIDPGVNSAFTQALLKLLNPKQASLSDPDLASQSQANRVAQQRSYERRRAATAEQAAFGGQLGGGLEAGIDTALAARGDAEGAFDADLLARKNDQSQESLLAALGPTLSLMGLGQNESQFGRDIALRKALAEAGLNQDAILRLLSGL